MARGPRRRPRGGCGAPPRRRGAPVCRGGRRGLGIKVHERCWGPRPALGVNSTAKGPAANPALGPTRGRGPIPHPRAARMPARRAWFVRAAMRLCVHSLRVQPFGLRDVRGGVRAAWPLAAGRKPQPASTVRSQPVCQKPPWVARGPRGWCLLLLCLCCGLCSCWVRGRGVRRKPPCLYAAATSISILKYTSLCDTAVVLSSWNRCPRDADPRGGGAGPCAALSPDK